MNEPTGDAELALLNERRALLRRLSALATVGMASGSAVLTACGGGGGGGGGAAFVAAATSAAQAPAPAPAPSPPPAPAPAPAPASAAPALGAHVLAFNRDGVTSSSLSASGMTTRTSGSTLLACVGRGLLAADLPTDTAGNAFVQLGAAHTYTLWPKKAPGGPAEKPSALSARDPKDVPDVLVGRARKDEQ